MTARRLRGVLLMAAAVLLAFPFVIAAAHWTISRIHAQADRKEQ